jgi:2-polyprenyl-3-methyl-5-hydroxy-6-metoxy-1,4-benzoquinol methylase
MTERTYDPKAVADWFNVRSAEYDKVYYEGDGTVYCGDKYRLQHVSQIVDALRPARILDIGCGSGIVSMELVRRGHTVVGIDLAEGMIAQAKQKAQAAGYDPNNFMVGDILDPNFADRFAGKGFDLVTTAGVLPYINDPETAHDNIRKILPVGGHYVGSYGNGLFDIFTLNRFTVSFHEKMAQGLDLPADMRKKVVEGVRGLLTKPDEPKKIALSASNELYSRTDNPLTIGADLARHGMQLEDMLFYKFHAYPPLVADSDPDLAASFLRVSEMLEHKFARDWRAYFLTTSFIVKAVRV